MTKTKDPAYRLAAKKGYKSFFRGSVLMYRRNDKACICQKDKAGTVPLAW